MIHATLPSRRPARGAALAGLLVLGLAAGLAAQKPCLSAYDNNTFQDNVSSSPFNVCIEATTGSAPIPVFAIEIFSGERSGACRVSIWDHDAANNRPGKLLGSGTFDQSLTNSWQGANLSAPVILQPNTKFWVGWLPPSGAQTTVEGTGGGQRYFWTRDDGKSWNGPYQSFRWKWRIHCAPQDFPGYTTYGSGCRAPNARSAPRIGSNGLPRIAQSFAVTMASPHPNAPAVFTLGGSDKTWGSIPLPLDLTPFGASNCLVLCDYAITIGQVTTGSGDASQTIALPNDPSLLKAAFYDQWAVTVPNANALNLVFSDGGKGVIGQ